MDGEEFEEFLQRSMADCEGKLPYYNIVIVLAPYVIEEVEVTDDPDIPETIPVGDPLYNLLEKSVDLYRYFNETDLEVLGLDCGLRKGTANILEGNKAAVGRIGPMMTQTSILIKQMKQQLKTMFDQIEAKSKRTIIVSTVSPEADEQLLLFLLYIAKLAAPDIDFALFNCDNPEETYNKYKDILFAVVGKDGHLNALVSIIQGLGGVYPSAESIIKATEEV